MIKIFIMGVTYLEKPDFGDPTDVEQTFCRFDIKVHCCHHWRLSTWISEDHSCPYWRFYWNRYPGAMIMYDGKTRHMSGRQVWLIPPNTPFSSFFDPTGTGAGHRVHISGGPVTEEVRDVHTVDNLFVHFNLGMPFDSASPELFEIDLSNDVMKMLEKLVDVLNGESEHFDFKSSLLIQSILTNTLLELPEQIWSVLSQDERVEKAVRYIEGNLSESLSNEECAKMVSMATNSFARLFQTDMGISLGQYILKRRMAQACQLLHHTQSSIDLIADEVGFCNRHHFSRMFKKVIGESPAFYRKTLRMKPIKS